MVITLGFSLIGYMDDHHKLMKKTSGGISGKIRLIGEFLISSLVIWSLIRKWFSDQ